MTSGEEDDDPLLELGLGTSPDDGATTEALPEVGLGTYDADEDACTAAVACALDAGYRHVDTAEMYENEAAVAAGVAASDVNLDPEDVARIDAIDRTERQVDFDAAPWN